ncbi:MAG: glycine/sarcosine/betaine reductase selenoprotein B family protein, partial [Pyrinomonadaceae bacterium]
NRRAPFTPARRALPMLNLALISSAGVYIDGTNSFDLNAAGGDLNFREIPIEVKAVDLQFAASGYDPAAVEQDLNVQLPLERLLEFEVNGIIGQLNPVFWSFSGFITDAFRLADRAYGSAGHLPTRGRARDAGRKRTRRTVTGRQPSNFCPSEICRGVPPWAPLWHRDPKGAHGGTPLQLNRTLWSNGWS